MDGFVNQTRYYTLRQNLDSLPQDSNQNILFVIPFDTQACIKYGRYVPRSRVAAGRLHNSRAA